MQLIPGVIFITLLVALATLGHHLAQPDFKRLPLTTVLPRLCEGNGHIKEVIQYNDTPNPLHVLCTSGAWLTTDR